MINSMAERFHGCLVMPRERERVSKKGRLVHRLCQLRCTLCTQIVKSGSKLYLVAGPSKLRESGKLNGQRQIMLLHFLHIKQIVCFLYDVFV